MKKSIIHIEIPRNLKAKLVKLANKSEHKKLEPYLVSKLYEIVRDFEKVDEDELEMACEALKFLKIAEHFSINCEECKKSNVRIYCDNKLYLCGSCLIDKAIKGKN